MTTKSFRVFEHFGLPLHWINFEGLAASSAYFFPWFQSLSVEKRGNYRNIGRDKWTKCFTSLLIRSGNTVFHFHPCKGFCWNSAGKLLYSLMSFSCSHKQNGRCCVASIYPIKRWIWSLIFPAGYFLPDFLILCYSFEIICVIVTIAYERSIGNFPCDHYGMS